MDKVFHCIKYRNILIGTINFTSSGQIRTNLANYRTRAIKNRMACFCTTSPNERLFASKQLDGWQDFYTDKGDKLFIAPQCRIARDLFRNSGYKITRDRENADRVVIPALPIEKQFLYFDVVMYDTESSSLYLLTVNRNEEYRRNLGTFSENDFQNVKFYFDNNFNFGNIQWFQDNFCDKAICEFLPQYEDYKSILTGQLSKDYVFEQNVEVDCPIEINLDTLHVWKYCKDEEILAKAICNSNWKDYPALLCVFLEEKCPHIEYFGGRNTKLVLDQIGYDRNMNLDSMLADRTIEPKDWNLLQDYIMDELGVSESGGYIDRESANENKQCLKLVRDRRVVAPLKINTPLLYENISSMLK